MGKEIAHEIAERRAGDPDVLVADSSRSIEVLGWEPRYKDEKEIISTAWEWMG